MSYVPQMESEFLDDKQNFPLLFYPYPKMASIGLYA